MRCNCWLLHRPSVAGVVLAVAALSLAGCSSLGPEYAGNEGTIEGTVETTTGRAVPEMSVRLWGGIDEQCDPIEYRGETDATGTYSLTEIDLGDASLDDRTFQIYVNRSVSSATPLNDDYGTYVASVTVSASGTWHDVLIAEAPPGPPDNYFE